MRLCREAPFERSLVRASPGCWIPRELAFLQRPLCWRARAIAWNAEPRDAAPACAT